VIYMTVKTTAENIKSRLEALTEITGQDDKGKDITEKVLDNVVIGDYDTDQMPPGKVLSIRAVTEEGHLDYAGPNPPDTPFTVPWHLTLYVSGPISKATLEVYRIVPLLKDEIIKDMTFNNSCIEASWAKPSVIYDEVMKTTSRMISGARIIFMTTHD
jgi:hypothetical protein